MQSPQERARAIFGHQAETLLSNAEAMAKGIGCLEEAERDTARPHIETLVATGQALTAVLAGPQGPQPTEADRQAEEARKAAEVEVVVVDDTHDDEDPELDHDTTPVDSGYGDDAPPEE